MLKLGGRLNKLHLFIFSHNLLNYTVQVNYRKEEN